MSRFNPLRGGAVCWRRMRALRLPLLLGAGSLLGAVAANMAPAESGPVAVVFPPWWGAARSIIAASSAGPVLRYGLPFVVVVVPQSRHPFGVLRRNGAWALVNPDGFGGCGGLPAAWR